MTTLTISSRRRKRVRGQQGEDGAMPAGSSDRHQGNAVQRPPGPSTSDAAVVYHTLGLL